MFEGVTVARPVVVADQILDIDDVQGSLPALPLLRESLGVRLMVVGSLVVAHGKRIDLWRRELKRGFPLRFAVMAHDSEGLSAQFGASAEQLQSLYDSWAPDYDADVESWGYQVPVEVASALMAEGVGQEHEVLDAGCGTGGSGVALKQAGFASVVGIDFSTESLARAKAREVYEVVAAVDLTKPLPFRDHRFAAVGSAGVFTYIDDVEATLRELLRVTESGGVIVFSQRTDLWEARGCDAVLAGLEAAELCTAESTEPKPYLPGHPEYGDIIGVIYTTLRIPIR